MLEVIGFGITVITCIYAIYLAMGDIICYINQSREFKRCRQNTEIDITNVE